jgi:hypothetical protein
MTLVPGPFGPLRRAINCTRTNLHRERAMIRIFIRDKRWGEVEVVNGKLHVVSDDGTLEGLINSPCLRHDENGKELTD